MRYTVQISTDVTQVTEDHRECNNIEVMTDFDGDPKMINPEHTTDAGFNMMLSLLTTAITHVTKAIADKGRANEGAIVRTVIENLESNLINSEIQNDLVEVRRIEDEENREN